MIAMVSQPMANKSDLQIETALLKAYKYLSDEGYETVSSQLTDKKYTYEAFMNLEEQGIENIPLYYLAKSLEIMSKCDTVYFCKGWKQARGCKIEHEAAKAYGLKIEYEI